MSWIGNYRGIACIAAVFAAGGLFAFSGLTHDVKAGGANTTDEKNLPAVQNSSPVKQDGPGPILQKFMRQKLHASTQILEGLCTDDLEMVNNGTETLLKMSREEQWRVSNDIMYRRYSDQFVNAVEEMKKEVGDKNIDGTSLAWVSVTMKCLKCHEWVRNTTLADASEK